MGYEDAHIWIIKYQFLYRWYAFVSLNYVINVFSNTSYFHDYTLEVLSKIGTVEHNEHVVRL